MTELAALAENQVFFAKFFSKKDPTLKIRFTQGEHGGNGPEFELVPLGEVSEGMLQHFVGSYDPSKRAFSIGDYLNVSIKDRYEHGMPKDEWHVAATVDVLHKGQMDWLRLIDQLPAPDAESFNYLKLDQASMRPYQAMRQDLSERIRQTELAEAELTQRFHTVYGGDAQGLIRLVSRMQELQYSQQEIKDFVQTLHGEARLKTLMAVMTLQQEAQTKKGKLPQQLVSGGRELYYHEARALTNVRNIHKMRANGMAVEKKGEKDKAIQRPQGSEKHKASVTPEAWKDGQFGVGQRVDGRDNQEDYYTMNETVTPHGKRVWFSVEDGAGGGQHGEWASKKAANAIQNSEGGTEIAKKNLDQVQQAVSQMATKASIKIGTTVAAIFIDEQNHVDTLHVGDTSILWIRRGTCIWESESDSLVGKLQRLGQITEAEAHQHTLKNVLSTALGDEQYQLHHKQFEQAESGDIFLIMSDGPREKFLQDQLAQIASQTASMQGLADTLLSLIPQEGDNKTIVSYQVP